MTTEFSLLEILRILDGTVFQAENDLSVNQLYTNNK